MIFIYVLCFRVESSFRSFSRPVLHAAARVVQEMGKSRAAAFALGVQDIDEGVDLNAVADDTADQESIENPFSEGKQCTEIVCYEVVHLNTSCKICQLRKNALFLL